MEHFIFVTHLAGISILFKLKTALRDKSSYHHLATKEEVGLQKLNILPKSAQKRYDTIEIPTEVWLLEIAPVLC